MPVATLHLVSLRTSSSLTDLLGAIAQTPSHQPFILAKPIRWVIFPERIAAESLLKPSKPWDLLYIHLGKEPLPDIITKHIQDEYTLQTGIPSRVLKDFPTVNTALLHPATSSIPKLTGALDDPKLTTSSQDLTLSTSLQEWIQQFSMTRLGKSAVSMLNLLSFKESKGMKESYIKYGQEFARSIGSRRGGQAKLVGHVIADGTSSNDSRWHEFALAHYPSILHFADMLASKDYQDVNQKYRVPALYDTCILCTSEIAIEDLYGPCSSSLDIIKGAKEPVPKL